MDNQKKLGKNQIQFKCEICDNEFKNKNTLKKHFNNTHNNLEKEHKCNTHPLELMKKVSFWNVPFTRLLHRK